MSRRKSRDLSPEERRLWNKVTDTVTPKQLSHPIAPMEFKTLAKTSVPKSSAKPAKPKARRVTLPAYYPPVSKLQKPEPLLLAPIDAKSRRRLKRGQHALDGTLDLHGMTQQAAHQRLIQFLIQAQAGGARYVLVITGKGKAANPDTGERGILRRMVPNWLSDRSLSSLVSGYDEAHVSHGGSGALYVRLRRQRSGGYPG
ncbi:MAG: Smr/MutS family protein [Hyphomicrobiales bacterium]